MKYIINIINKIELNGTTWIVYEVGKRKLSERLYSIKMKNQMYQIKHQLVYNLLLQSKGILVNLITYICEALQVLQQFELIHCDLTPENILVEFNEYNTILETIKIVDFGSSLHHRQLDRICSFTPEYMPPEILTYMSSYDENN